jgi:cell division protein FtsW
VSAAIRHPGEFRWETRLLSVTTLVLTAVGIASCYAAGTYLPEWHREASQQLMAAIVGGGIFILAANADYRIWRKVALPMFLATVVGLVLIAMVAVAWRRKEAPGPLRVYFPLHSGAHRWIKAGAQFQFSEIARVTLAVWLAAHAATLGTKVRDFSTGFLPLIGTIGIVCVLVAVEPSVSMAVALGVIGLSVIFTAGARIPHVAIVALVAAAGVLLILKFDPVRANRDKSFHGRAVDCVVDDQACQSLIGFGDGGVHGVGFDRGTQKFGHLPEAYSDFLLSVIGEEWGFVGVSFVVLCFILFCWMGFRIARTAPDPFGTYLASGLTVAVGITAFMHAAVVTWLMPTTGLTLPFMSVGRISLLLYLLSAGVIVSIGRQRGRPVREK